jgi:hypothetical protein
MSVNGTLKMLITLALDSDPLVKKKCKGRVNNEYIDVNDKLSVDLPQ